LADKLAHAAFIVLVEDRESDGVLLDIIVEELGWPELRECWNSSRRATPRATEIVTAGGKDAIPQRIERIVNDATVENRYHRLFVLCDCDARWPGDSAVERLRPVTAVIEACAKYSVPHHIWRKRSAENYIPDEVFVVARDDPRNMGHIERFNAFLRRSRMQRDHFPIEDGLNATERELATYAGLYEASEASDLELLEERLFPKRKRLLQRLNHERRSSFTADGLRARDGNNELDELLRKISVEL
jgi:hypothetical protein